VFSEKRSSDDVEHRFPNWEFVDSGFAAWSRSISAAISTVYSSDRQAEALLQGYLRLAHTYNAIMSMFRSKKLDLGGFVNIKVIRDHTKRKVFEQNETERSVDISISVFWT
jgi:hypothetical protein